MTDIIRIAVLDFDESSLENIRQLLSMNPRVEVVFEDREASSGLEKVNVAKPSVVLVDNDLPDMSGVLVAGKINATVPGTQVVLMSSVSDSDLMREAMVAGARDLIVKPFTYDELWQAIERAYLRYAAVSGKKRGTVGEIPERGVEVARAPGHVIAVYSPKGGTGTTTVTVNLAASLAARGYRTAIIDGSLQFGDVSYMLNLKPSNTISSLFSTQSSRIDADQLEGALSFHKSGIALLAAPASPQDAELVSSERLPELVETMRVRGGYVFIDVPAQLGDSTIAFLDSADMIILVAQQELTTLARGIKFLELAEQLDIVPERILLVINRALKAADITLDDVAEYLKRTEALAIPEDMKTSRAAVNKGKPFVSQSPRRDVALAYEALADRIAADFPVDQPGQEPTEVSERGLFERMIGRS